MRYNHAGLFAALATAIPEKECIIFRDRRFTFGDTSDRVNRLANLLLSRSITAYRSRQDLQPWESGQDHVALYLYNGNEYLEGMLGSAAARAASFNVNFRYVEAELAYLLNDASARAIIFHATFAPQVAAVLDRLDEAPRLMLQVADGSGNPLVEGALDYEEALASSSPEPPCVHLDPEDLYLLYTGGTTGMPKGTMWSQAAMFESTVARYLPAEVFEVDRIEDAVDLILAGESRVMMPVPPLVHGAAQWVALAALLTGGTVVFPDVVDRFDPHSVWQAVDREGVQYLNLVGNAFATPLCDELERGAFHGRSLKGAGVGGAITSAAVKDRLLRLLPHISLVDSAGSSESGPQLSSVATAQAPATTGTFTPSRGTCVVDETRGRILSPGEDATGWLATRGAIPFGYLGDPEKTEATFAKVAGHRMVLSGDRARHMSDGSIELLGRESMTINTGGEKVFAEEVEDALMAHPAVRDVVVVGRPNERWGSEIVGVVQLAKGQEPTDDELVATAGERLARYKLPKALIRVDVVLRSPTGKADYAWARNVALQDLSQAPDRISEGARG